MRSLRVMTTGRAIRYTVTIPCLPPGFASRCTPPRFPDSHSSSVSCAFLAAAAFGQDAAGKVTAFLSEHCVSCHGPDVHKAGLRLDTLGNDLSDEASFAKWVKVHDKVAEGKMPPKKSAQPPKAESNAFLKSLHDQLHAASLSRQETKGRVVLRRLNATEYENTLRELVGTKVRVKENLPDESTVAGFDNASPAASTSPATHLLLYQDAAEKAVQSAVPTSPPYPIKQRIGPARRCPRRRRTSARR